MKKDKEQYKLSIYSNLKGEINFVAELLSKMGINHMLENIVLGYKPKESLYLRDGSIASLKDVCKWWIKTYPPDVFVNKPKPVVEARMCMQNILVMMHKPEVNKPSLSQNNKKEDGIPPTNELVGILPKRL